MQAIGRQPHRRRMALRSTTNAIAPSRPRCTTFDEQNTRRLQLNARSLSDSRCDGTTHLVLSPLEFMQRLAALGHWATHAG